MTTHMPLDSLPVFFRLNRTRRISDILFSSILLANLPLPFVPIIGREWSSRSAIRVVAGRTAPIFALG